MLHRLIAAFNFVLPLSSARIALKMTAGLAGLLALLALGLAGCTAGTPPVSATTALTAAVTRTATAATLTATARPASQATPITQTPEKSCTGCTQLESIPVPTQKYSPYRTEKSPTPHYPSPTPTAVTPLAWNPQLPGVVHLENFDGTWSPTYDEIAGVQIGAEQNSDGIGIATAPEFRLSSVDLGDVCTLSPSLTWSPDGRRILFYGPTIGQLDWCGELEGDLWVMDRSGKNIHPVKNGSGPYRFLTFIGWRDERTLVLSGYAGGGHTNVYAIDFLGEETLSQTLNHGPTFQPNKTYIPGVFEEVSRYWLFAWTPQLQSEPFGYTDDFYSLGMHPDLLYTLLIPNKNIPYINSSFKAWLPGENKILAYGFTYADNGIKHIDSSNETLAGEAYLVVWDVDKNAVTPLVPNGVDGRFSADGRWLAAVTLGKPRLGGGSRFTFGPADSLAPGGQPYLALVAMDTRQVSLSLPALAPVKPIQGDYPAPNHEALAGFSPDSRYLAFLSPGPVQLDQAGKPLGVDTTGNTPALNVLDLASGQMIFSAPSAAQAPVWSPRSDRLVYQDPQGNWQMYDLKARQATALTASGGGLLSDPAWSHSGRYLRFEQILEDGPVETYILPWIP